MLAEAKEALRGLNSTMQSIDRNVTNLEKFTGPLGERGEQIIANVDGSVARLNEIVVQVERFTRRINSDEGTVGQLLNNPELYQQLNEAAMNINDLTRRLRPIVEDARVLSDRVSRNPGIIIRDAVKPGAGTKWSTPQ
jgi:phospholipid/cholesterol/gamma-HCH transport system substrate-binding protein